LSCKNLSVGWLLLFLTCFTASNAQSIDRKKWVSLFNQPFDGRHAATELLWDSIRTYPKPIIQQIITEIQQDKSINGSETGQLKLALLKLRYCQHTDDSYHNTSWRELGAQVLQLSTIAQNGYLLQAGCDLLGDIYLRRNQPDTAIFYLLKSVALAEGLGYQKEIVANNKIAASNVLYRTQNYRECIAFCANVIGIENVLTPIAVVTAYNNSGLAYLKLGQPDSAIFFFTKAMHYSKQKVWGIWEGIAAGNIGDALHAKGQKAEALPYWQKDYDTSLQYGELPNAGLTLAYISEYQFEQGDREKAIRQLQWSEKVNNGDGVNLLRIYKIKAALYRSLGLHDSADLFLDRHYHIADSINRVVSAQNFNTVQLRLAHEKNAYEYSLLQKQRQAEVIRRNLLLVAFGAMVFIGWLLYNRQKLKTGLARQKQALAEAETASAREQLAIFTQTLLEKNRQIEQLNASLVQQMTAVSDELIHQTLLTDYDWNKFRDLFEKLHPGFFPALKKMAPAITQSEMRLAALLKLNLDNKQMASMQGISVSSLRGNKTRLRQKLNISPEMDLEDVIREL